jgi:hypothetical protein
MGYPGSKECLDTKTGKLGSKAWAILSQKNVRTGTSNVMFIQRELWEY